MHFNRLKKFKYELLLVLLVSFVFLYIFSKVNCGSLSLPSCILNPFCSTLRKYNVAWQQNYKGYSGYADWNRYCNLHNNFGRLVLKSVLLLIFLYLIINLLLIIFRLIFKKSGVIKYLVIIIVFNVIYLSIFSQLKCENSCGINYLINPFCGLGCGSSVSGPGLHTTDYVCKCYRHSCLDIVITRQSAVSVVLILFIFLISIVIQIIMKVVKFLSKSIKR